MTDQPLPEDEAISDAHPSRTGRHDLYDEAMRLVGAKHSKQALVLLVNWLLTERATDQAMICNAMAGLHMLEKRSEALALVAKLRTP